jgi:hypothetical protein
MTGSKLIHVDMHELEEAFESDVFAYYLDTESGKCLAIPQEGWDDDITEEMEEEIELVESAPPGRLLSIDRDDVDIRPSLEDASAFASSVEDGQLRQRLTKSLMGGRGAFRRFLDVLHEEAGELDRWDHFERQKRHENIAAWLAQAGVNVTYDPLLPYQPRFDTRRHLLTAAATFVARVKRIQGVKRIALIGSTATAKREPNGVDLLLTIASTDVVPELAAAGRKLQGHAQQIGRGANVFLADPSGKYLGRTCPWRECGPGIRRACQAQHCGGHLYDDLQFVTLEPPIIAAPPLELWPDVVMRANVPADVLEAFAIPQRKG